jgi:hypothetical protein
VIIYLDPFFTAETGWGAASDIMCIVLGIVLLFVEEDDDG